MFRAVVTIFLVALCLSSAARVRTDPANKKLRNLGNAVALKSHNNASVHAMEVIGDKCKCKFIGHCTCRQAIQFMDCISDSCASGDCDCHAQQFQHSCFQMADTCNTLGMGCTEDRATCTHEPVYADESTDELLADLAHLKDRKCKLEEAKRRGFLNAEKRHADVMAKIQGVLDMLKKKDYKCEEPNMDCDKPMLTGKVCKDDEKKGEEEEEEEEEPPPKKAPKSSASRQVVALLPVVLVTASFRW
eukprot:gnl/TRDRNA2_/TRDRNA2_131488_c0_seq1.p1 gnl/TRDRNA2_/TRDRNA2_131488_c0~~gnl/TRDRNA2_/TRDRNA2_131488_c0_seq1.p1  ORF type:complete len:246 (+),score=74.43 gnl/TRDRNA2_/TRDRNA2_131488_c0_seq1:92-829(+)